MENIDAFAEEYMERARQRRERLTKKLADTSPRRKRNIPLAENTEVNIVVSTASTSTDDDSPNKRQCLREEELTLKPDTPAIPGVRSRMGRLAQERKHWEDGTMETEQQEVPVQSEVPKLELRDKSPAPSARRNRLAALAQNISEWQDDSNHPIHKKEEKPKKTWQPPKVEVTEPAQKTPPSPVKPQRMYTEETTKSYSPVKAPSPAKAHSPAKALMTSPRKETKQEGNRVVSSLMVNIGGNPTRSEGPSKGAVTSPRKTASYQVKPAATSPVKQPAHSAVKPKESSAPIVNNVVASLKKSAGDNKRRESFEPSAQPVSARLACWQGRVDRVESETMDTCNNAASRMKIPQIPKTPVISSSTTAATGGGRLTEEPTNTPVHSRKANWEQKIQQEEQNTPRPKSVAMSAPRPTSANLGPKSPQKNAPTAVKSPVKSPSKVAPGTKTIQDKLNKLQNSWKDNEIAEKIKEQRQADLNVLENRWKNGMLNEEHTHTQDNVKSMSGDSVEEKPSGIPAPPPLPANLSAKSTPASTGTKTPLNKTAPRHPSGKTPKEQARDKIRQDFEDKLKTLGFEVDEKHATLDLKSQRELEKKKRDAEKNNTQNVQVTEKFVTTVHFENGQKVTRKEVVHTGTPSRTTVKSVATPSGGSIYGLIKKQGNGAQTATPSSTNKVTTMKTMGSTPGGRNASSKFHDSFSSDETSFEEDLPSKTVEIKQSITFQSAEDESTTADETESQGCDTASQSGDEYSDESEEGDMTEYTMDETLGSSQSDPEEDEDSYSETETEASSTADFNPHSGQRQEKPSSPQYMARKLPPEAHPGHPDHVPPPQPQGAPRTPSKQLQYNHQPQSAPRTPGTAPPKHPRLHEQQQKQPEKHVGFISPGGSTYRANSSGSEKSIRREKPYSIDNYRSSANVKRNAPEPRMTIIRRSEHFDTDSTETDHIPYVPEESAKQKIQELQELVTQEQNVIMQTSNALNQCCGSTSAFAGSQESVECHRLLLQACKKREAYIAEMQKLKTYQQTPPKGPKGSLTINDIRLPLKNEFVANLGTVHDNTVHYFMVLFRHAAHVIFTQMVSTQDALIRGSLDIPNLIKLNDIRENFVVDMEIYHMSVTREMTTDKTPKKKKGMTPKKLSASAKKHHPAFQSPGGPQAVRSTNFTFIASMPLTMKAVDKTHFSLDRVPFSSPLHGTIHMRLRCLMEVSVEEKGFLTMFEDVSGLGAWHRRWCVLRHNVVSFWKYPDDAKNKDPIGTIDLKCCISDEIGLVPRDVCARPNTLELLTVRRQHRGESDTLVSRCYNTMTTTKHWISADTKEDRAVWAIKLNEALKNLRAWNPDALRPIKRQQKQS